ncbi:YeeE/YedE family protein [Faecalibacter rhinopitheci]|uniref:YeeE/YedE family protein n=1 Tax=Faecalibacter rhinopitheci TaxID=2779678 RepID=A0A8J7K4T4_9FLAO|nr:YeeE/YedE thiosulfate transporter family protein [Faecalibacter rhinopitheci]MBF0598039.1 YeeE/YedE family protein [Faecalibacter rhinopitheci]MBQ0146906.1 YeeE/YedE family protein [Candidatus Onthonaster equi]
MNLIFESWPWYVGGPIIAIVMLLLIYFGKSFGFSSNFRNLCALFGAGKSCDFFSFDWRTQKWNLLFLVGAVLGGLIASTFLSNNQTPELSELTVRKLNELGFESAGKAYSPTELFGNLSLKNILILLIGGLFVGFGTRYAGGCTSGHAISGLSDLQLPSLIAVIGFFIGGLIMVHLIFPLIF